MNPKFYDIPAGFKISVDTTVGVRFKDEADNFWGLKDSELIQTDKPTSEAITLLSELKVLQEDRTYLQISSQKKKTFLQVRLNKNDVFPELSQKEVLTLNAFGSSGYLMVKGRDKVPLRPATYRRDVLQKIVPLIAEEKVKPTMDVIGKWIVLDLLFPKNEQKMLTKMAIADIRFDILIELYNQGLITE